MMSAYQVLSLVASGIIFTMVFLLVLIVGNHIIK